MQKSRRGAKYKQLRHPKDAMYSYHAFKVFLSKLNRHGKTAHNIRCMFWAFRGCKLLLHQPPSWVAFRAIKTLWNPLTAVRTRKGKAIIVIPVPSRRNKKTIIARHCLARAAYTTPHRRRIENSVKKELIATFNNLRGGRAVQQHSTFQTLLYEHRTEMELRWR